ncbi:MAG: peptide deformylase [Halofilum sp. (in: g-proteobacteria)]|nr:peptide deformylase [Halofilum sp. (in: g-proteobacteria)]
MALLDILQYPDERLRHVAEPVAEVDERVRALADDMVETMYAASGIGLAATQVGVDERIAVIDVSPEHDQPLVLINPEILEREGEQESEEGCLSIPGVYDRVRRAERVRVRALDRDGAEFELEADGLLAVCIQHEVDHLNGRLFIDYLSMLKRRRLDKKLAKQRRREHADADRALG